jgi:uncharacterized protein YbcC (UPF0753/DUF2309 family)
MIIIKLILVIITINEINTKHFINKFDIRHLISKEWIYLTKFGVYP